MKPFFLFLLAMLSLTAGCQRPTQNPVAATDPDAFVNVNDKGVIIDGYDPVAFFTEGKPTLGNPELTATHHGAIYQFATEEHQRLFQQNPDKYAVQFGGWCAYAISLGRIAPIKINTWSIVDGRLVIQHNQRAVRGWEKDVAGNLKKADKYWPYVAGNQGNQILTDEERGFLVNTDRSGVIIDGYDPVAYFTEERARQGKPELSARYNGATYHFATTKHQTMFKDNPTMFLPEYGAFCAYAMSKDKLRPINPELFQIVDGRLMLQHSQKAYDLFNEELQSSVTKADNNWPKQVAAKAGGKVNYDKPAN